MSERVFRTDKFDFNWLQLAEVDKRKRCASFKCVVNGVSHKAVFQYDGRVGSFGASTHWAGQLKSEKSWSVDIIPEDQKFFNALNKRIVDLLLPHVDALYDPEDMGLEKSLSREGLMLKLKPLFRLGKIREAKGTYVPKPTDSKRWDSYLRSSHQETTLYTSKDGNVGDINILTKGLSVRCMDMLADCYVDVKNGEVLRVPFRSVMKKVTEVVIDPHQYPEDNSPPVGMRVQMNVQGVQSAPSGFAAAVAASSVPMPNQHDITVPVDDLVTTKTSNKRKQTFTDDNVDNLEKPSNEFVAAD